MKFTYLAPLRFSDTDAMGHVNNARFLSYLEDGRVALLVKLGDGAPFAPGLIVARIEIDYIRPVMLSKEPIKVEMWVSRIGGKSFTIDYDLTHEGNLVAKAKSVIVAFDYATQTSRELNETEKAALAEYQAA